MNIDALIETMLVLFIVTPVGYVANKKGIFRIRIVMLNYQILVLKNNLPSLNY